MLENLAMALAEFAKLGGYGYVLFNIVLLAAYLFCMGGAMLISMQ